MPDPIYVAARTTLLDALEAVRDHLDAVVLVGAQAVYLFTGDADLAIAPYTTDADLALDPTRLSAAPRLDAVLAAANFTPSPTDVGAWIKKAKVEGVMRDMVVDLLVPDSLGGGGRRAARIPPHARRTARKVTGIEGALVDADRRPVAALESSDARCFEVMVAGPAALVVAKIFKIADRLAQGRPDRSSDKDALDVLRLLRATTTDELANRFAQLRAADLSRPAAEGAIVLLPEYFGSPRATGCVMAARAGAPLEPGDTIAAATAALTQDLIHRL